MSPQPAKPPRPVSAEDLKGDAVLPGDPLYGTVWINPERMSGVPCFYGTRVPVKNLFDSLRAGHSIVEFLADFPGVTRQQVDAVLVRAWEGVGGHAA